MTGMKNIFYIVVFYTIALLSAPSMAEIHEYNLTNGLKLLVKEDHRAPVAVSQVWYKVGSSYEHDGITGISHVLEHMMFKGTEQYPPGEFSRIISANGGRDNAFTGADYTAYFQTLESARLEISFQLEADRMRGLIIPEQEFLKEIEVVKEERRLRTDDNPQSYTREAAMATAFQTSPYRQPIVGWMHDLNAMNVQRLKVWYRNWYAPNNAVVVVVGDVVPDEVHQLVKKHFGPIPAGNVATLISRPEIKQSGVKRLKIKRPARLPYLMMAYKVPVLSSAIGNKYVADWEPYALEVLTGILDGGNSARFASRLVRGQEVAADTSVGYNMVARLDYVFTIAGTPSQDRSAKELEIAFRQEIINLQSQPVAEAELQRVKMQTVAANVYQKDSAFFQALILGLLETVGLDWKMADQYVDKINAVTAEQIMTVANKYLIDDRLTVAELDPQPISTGQRVTAGEPGRVH